MPVDASVYLSFSEYPVLWAAIWCSMYRGYRAYFACLKSVIFCITVLWNLQIRFVTAVIVCSMIDTYSDDFGLLDFRRSQHGSGMSSRSQVYLPPVVIALQCIVVFVACSWRILLSHRWENNLWFDLCVPVLDLIQCDSVLYVMWSGHKVKHKNVLYKYVVCE